MKLSAGTDTAALTDRIRGLPSASIPAVLALLASPAAYAFVKSVADTGSSNIKLTRELLETINWAIGLVERGPSGQWGQSIPHGNANDFAREGLTVRFAPPSHGTRQTSWGTSQRLGQAARDLIGLLGPTTQELMYYISRRNGRVAAISPATYQYLQRTHRAFEAAMGLAYDVVNGILTGPDTEGRLRWALSYLRSYLGSSRMFRPEEDYAFDQNILDHFTERERIIANGVAKILEELGPPSDVPQPV